MKYFTILLFAFFMSSCCSAKQEVHKPKKNSMQFEEVVAAKVNSTASETIIEETQPEIKEIPIEAEKEVIVVKQQYSVHFNSNTIYVIPHDKWNELLQKHVSEAGNVNYKGFKEDRETLNDYIRSLAENLPSEDWTKEDKLAYWMNAYNAMTVDLIVQYYPIKSIKDIKDPWKQRLWKLGNKWYNLEEIEHEILRKMNEPRIHFGIVCASFSCPKLQNEAFTASQLEKQLTKATKEFLADPNKNYITSHNIKISKIFQWFSKDFKQNGSLIDFLNQYSDLQISSNAKRSYKDYNWDLNE